MVVLVEPLTVTVETISEVVMAEEDPCYECEYADGRNEQAIRTPPAAELAPLGTEAVAVRL